MRSKGLDSLLHTRQGEPDAARQRLEAAQSIFVRLDAQRDLDRIQQALGAGSSAPS